MAQIDGTNDSDLLLGTDEDDQIFGLDGDDFILALGGNDTLDGGPGTDSFVFGSTWTQVDGFTDIVWDLEDGVEKLDMRTSGLTFADLTIDDTGFIAIITSTAGRSLRIWTARRRRPADCRRLPLCMTSSPCK